MEDLANILRTAALHHGFVLSVPAAHEPKRERQPAPLLPRAVVPFVNVLLERDAVVVYRTLIAEQFLHEVARLGAIGEERENVEAQRSSVGLPAIPLTDITRTGKSLVDVIGVGRHGYS